MGGKRYWVAARIVATIEHHWEAFDGEALLKGVDALDIYDQSPSRFLSTAYVWLTRGATTEDKAKFDAALEQPPAGEDPEYVSEEAAEADFAMWRSAAGSGTPGMRA